MKKKVFLGGTCANSTWRNVLIPQLKIDYFNPVVDNWTPECQLEEIEQRENCDFCLYVITPRVQGFYSFAEVADDSNKLPDKTIFCYLAVDGESVFDEKQLKSLHAIGKMVQDNGGQWFMTLDRVAKYLNENA